MRTDRDDRADEPARKVWDCWNIERPSCARRVSMKVMSAACGLEILRSTLLSVSPAAIKRLNAGKEALGEIARSYNLSR